MYIQSTLSKIKRNSSIEILKIIGIILIVTSHVVQTLSTKANPFITSTDYVLNLSTGSTDVQHVILSMMKYCGTLGNTIFFVCSAWFLLDSKNVNKRKIFLMLAEIWTVSVLILIAVLFLRKGHLHGILVAASLLPSTFGNNWYLNCYILFYAIHPFLNHLIDNSSKRTMFRISVIMVFLYFIVAFATRLSSHLYGIGNTFFSSPLIIWIAIYFIIAYHKKYLAGLSSSRIFSFGLIIFGFVGNYGLILLTNYLELNSTLLNNSLAIWNEGYNPFIISLVLGLFNLTKTYKFSNKGINYTAKLSMYIYIIHENILLRTLYRPLMWNYIYMNYGYDHVLKWTLVLVAIIACFSFISSILYYQCLHKHVRKLCDKTYSIISRIWRVAENKLIQQ